MEATAEQLEDITADRPTTLHWDEVQREDAYWHRNFWLERYYQVEFDYEDYAPAYCVGYAGCAQYGGTFGDAERSLCANWERIKGDSRLSLPQALPAIRAAWERMARLRQRREQPAVNDASFAVARVRTTAPVMRPAVAHEAVAAA